MELRFTLSHAIEGSVVVSDPEGWHEATCGFSRDENLHSLVEYYKSSFSAYGSNGTENGGRDWLKNVEKLHGLDEIITILVEEKAENDLAYQPLFSGEVNIREFVETIDFDHRVDFGFTQTSFWRKFIARIETPVDLRSATTLDGAAIAPLDPVDVRLTPQILPMRHYEYLSEAGAAYDAAASGKYLEGAGDTVDLDEPKSANQFLVDITPTLPDANFVAEFAGSYTFNLRFELSMWFRLDLIPLPSAQVRTMEYSGGGHFVDYFISVNKRSPEIFTKTEYRPVIQKQSTVYTITTTKDLNVGDTVRVYGVINHNLPTDASEFGDGGPIVSSIIVWGKINQQILVDHALDQFGNTFDEDVNLDAISSVDGVPSGVSKPTFLDYTGKTLYPETICHSFFQHDVFGGILDRITGVPAVFTSPYLGGLHTKYKTYAADGKAVNYVNARGLQIRQYTLAEKPFSQSFKNQWLGANPIFNLAAWYDKINGVDQIVIGKREECYVNTPSVYLTNVKNIKRYYDQDMIINSVQIGYEKSKDDNIAGIDDSQFKRTFASILKTAGKAVTILSSFIGASITWEETRRLTREKSADNQYDDLTFILNVKRSGSDYVPALDEAFLSITNLQNSSTRYNTILSATRNFLRNINVLNGCLQSYLTSAWRFVSGEGNFDMTSTMADNGEAESFGGAVLSEKQNIPVTTRYLHLPLLYEIDHYLTRDQYKAIQANRHYAIAVSQTEEGFTNFFIKELSWERYNDGKVKILAWPKTFMDLKVINNEYQGESSGYVFSNPFSHPPFS